MNDGKGNGRRLASGVAEQQCCGEKKRSMWKGREQLGFSMPSLPFALGPTVRTCWWSETRRKVAGAHALLRSMWVSTEYRLRQEINHLSTCDQWKGEDGDVKFASMVTAGGPERSAHGARSRLQPMKPASRPAAPPRCSGTNGCLACRFHHPAKKKRWSRVLHPTIAACPTSSDLP